MQVSVESGEGLERRMTVGLDPEQIESDVDERLRELARSGSVKLPGFRPGKVPIKILRQRFGGQLRQEVFAELVKSSFTEALAEEDLRPAGPPTIEPDIDPATRHYAYTAVFEVLPEFELSTLEGKVIKRPTAEITDADLEAMITRLREQHKTWNAVQRPAREGDRLTVSFTGTMDGELFEGGSGEEVKIELGSGRMIQGFEDGLVGAEAGDERKLELQFPEEYLVQDLKGKPVAFDVRVGEVAEPVIPEVDADFAKAFGVEDGDLERFRSDVRANMGRELKERIDARIKSQAMDLLLDANQIDLPDVLVKNEIRTLKVQTRQRVAGGDFELPDELFQEQARRRVALGLVVAEVVRANEMKVDKERVREVVEDLASTYEQPQDVIEYYYSNKEHLASVESLTLENQVVDWVVENAAVVDEKATFEELTSPATQA
jgi:trigger factor